MAFAKKNNITVGVAVTADNRLEAVVVDKQARKILDYRKVPLDYNFQTKEISDYLTFGNMLRTMLIDEMHLSPKNIDVTITVPSIHFATTQLNSSLDNSAITMALTSMAQDSYLFKRHEPTIAYQQYPSSNKDSISVIYAALQEDAITQIRDVMVDNLGIENVAINNPYASIINALSYLGLIDEQVNSNEVWNFVQITNNGFTLFSMMGTRIIEINDMPIPLKTFAAEEIYESMALSLQNNLSIYPASSLFLLSRTDLLSAETLLQNMDLRGNVAFLENNKFSQAPLLEIDEIVDPDLAKVVSVEAIGSTITEKTSPLNLCYFSNKDSEEEIYGYLNFLNKEIPVTDTTINYFGYGIIALIAAFAGIIFLVFSMMNNSLDAKIAEYESKKQEIEQQINEARGKAEGNVENIIAEIARNNESTNKYFSAISAEIPNTIWLNHYYSNDSGALGIQGDTSDVDSLYDFFKNVRMSVENSDISLTKLEYNDINALLVGDGTSNTTVTFEIASPSYSNVVNMNAAQMPVGENGAADPNAQNAAQGTNTTAQNGGTQDTANTGNNPPGIAPNNNGNSEIVPPTFEPVDNPTK